MDTNVLSEVRKGARAHRGVARWFAEVESEELYVSVLVLGEIRLGIERLRRRDPRAAANLDVWLRRITHEHTPRILPVDARVADTWGRISGSRSPITAVDGLLAATAIVHDLTLVTRNVKDVEGTGASVLDPFA